MEQALGLREADADEQAERLHRHDDALERLTDEALHVLGDLHLLAERGALGRHALHLRGLGAHARHEVGKLAAHARLDGPRKHLLQDAVHHEVGIAPDGTREVAVRGRPQAVVAQVLRLVGRAFHGAQQQRAHKLLFGLAGDLVEHRLHGARVARDETGLVLRLEAAELVEQAHESRHAVVVGSLVHAEGTRQLRGHQAAGHSLVGRKHGLLHQARGARRAAHVNANGQTLVVETDLCLARDELDGAALATKALAKGADAVEPTEEGSQVNARTIGMRGTVGSRPLENRVDLAIGEAALRANDAGVDLRLLHEALGVHAHVDRHSKAVLARNERAQVAAQFLREHRNDAIGEVDACGAGARRHVDGPVLGHIGAHVGDVHAEQPPALGQNLERHRVVKVARVIGVDGHHKAVANVAPSRLRQRAVHIERERGGFLKHLGVEQRLQVV